MHWHVISCVSETFLTTCLDRHNDGRLKMNFCTYTNGGSVSLPGRLKDEVGPGATASVKPLICKPLAVVKRA